MSDSNEKKKALIMAKSLCHKTMARQLEKTQQEVKVYKEWIRNINAAKTVGISYYY